jgi:hypothetical protein
LASYSTDSRSQQKWTSQNSTHVCSILTHREERKKKELELQAPWRFASKVLSGLPRKTSGVRHLLPGVSITQRKLAILPELIFLLSTWSPTSVLHPIKIKIETPPCWDTDYKTFSEYSGTSVLGQFPIREPIGHR